MIGFAIATLGLARGVDVSDPELGAKVRTVRELVGSPIALVTPNQYERRSAEDLVGLGDYVFAQAGSPSETSLRALGVSCAVFLTRDALRAVRPWHVTPIGHALAVVGSF